MELLQNKFKEKIVSATERLSDKLQHLTFYQVADDWANYTAPMVKSETANNHKNYVRRIKRAIPDDLLFIDFKPATAEKIVYDMYYVEQLSYSYSKATFIIIKSILRYAKKCGYIDNISDFEDLHLKKRPSTKKELSKSTNKFLNQKELHECLRQLNEINKRLALAMEFIALTGLRCGELLALRIQDYFPKKNMININGSITRNSKNGDNLQRGTPKNIYSYRDVYLNTRAKQIIDWFILENKKSAKWNNKTYKDHGYIFTTSTGYPYNLQYINRILRMLNIPNKKISSHIFRHTHISMLAELSVPLKAIMERVGHNDPNTTLKIYTHVTDKMKQETIKQLENIVI